MIILLMGPQGSGKGTQGELLSKSMNIPLFGTGALLRAEIATGSELGKEIKKIINAGNLVPPDLATRLMASRVDSDEAKNGVLIDGYPRDEEQLGMMFNHFTPDLVIVLEISDDEAVKRLGGRWLCPDGHIWNVNSKTPKVKGKCDFDGKDLYQREDDKEDAIRKRLAIYHADTAPLIAGLEAKGVRVERVDASKGIEEISKSLKKLFA